MDDEDVDFPSHLSLSTGDLPSDFDEFLRKTSTCTHTHTCNPPRTSANGHTHTCYHTHTRVLASGEGEGGGGEEEELKKSRKPLGNREAVRKYREKKKAHAAYLEEEVKKLRQSNQQLLRRLQGQAALEAEVVRLRSLLVDLRGKIDTELGIFPFQKYCNGTGFQCDADVSCVGGNVGTADWKANCEPMTVDCQTDPTGNMEQHMEIKAASSMDMMRSFISSSS